MTWISPESDNIRDNLWGTLTIELLTAAETGLYKCNGAEGTSSIYISAIGMSFSFPSYTTSYVRLLDK